MLITQSLTLHYILHVLSSCIKLFTDCVAIGYFRDIEVYRINCTRGDSQDEGGTVYDVCTYDTEMTVSLNVDLFLI